METMQPATSNPVILPNKSKLNLQPTTNDTTPIRENQKQYNPRMLETSPTPHDKEQQKDSPQQWSRNVTENEHGLTEFPPMLHEDVEGMSSEPNSPSKLQGNAQTPPRRQSKQNTTAAAPRSFLGRMFGLGSGPSSPVVSPTTKTPPTTNTNSDSDNNRNHSNNCNTKSNENNNQGNDGSSNNMATTPRSISSPTTPKSISSSPVQQHNQNNESPSSLDVSPSSLVSRASFFNFFRAVPSPSDPNSAEQQPKTVTVDIFTPAYTVLSTVFPSSISMFANPNLPDDLQEIANLREVALRDEVTIDTVNACMTLFLDTERLSDYHRNEMAELLKVHARTDVGRNLIMQTGCVPSIAFLLVDLGTVESACNLIINLAYTHHESKQISEALIEAGAMKRLTWILEFGHDAAKTAAIKAMTNLVIGDDERKAQLVHTDGFPDVFVRCIGHQTGSVSLDACRLMCNVVKNKKHEILQTQLDPLVACGLARSIAHAISPSTGAVTTMVMFTLKKILSGPLTSFYQDFADAGGYAKVDEVLRACTTTFGYVKTQCKNIHATFKSIKDRMDELARIIDESKQDHQLEAAEFSLLPQSNGSSGGDADVAVAGTSDNDTDDDDGGVAVDCDAALAFVASVLDLADSSSAAPGYFALKEKVMTKFGKATLKQCKSRIQDMLEKYHLRQSVALATAPSEASQKVVRDIADTIVQRALESVGNSAKQEAKQLESERIAREELERFAWS